MINSKTFSQIAIIAILALIVAGIFQTPLWGDEKNYHVPSVVNFSFENVVNPDSDYASAYAPMPYLIGHIAWQVYPSHYTLRILNFIIFCCLLFLFYRVNHRDQPDTYLFTLLLVANPYLVRSAYSFYMFNYGLFFILLGIFFLYHSKWRLRHYAGSVALSLAVLSQQWMLIAVGSIFMIKFRDLLAENAKRAAWIKSAIQVLIALVPGILLFTAWGGLTHPNFAAHALVPTFAHLTGTLGNWGFALLLLALTKIRTILDSKYLPLLFVGALLFLGLPVHSYEVGPDSVTGVTTRIMGEISNFTGLSFQYLFFFPVLAGVVILIQLIPKLREKNAAIFAFAAVGFLTAFTASIRLGSSHIYLSIPFLIMALKRDIILSALTRLGLPLQMFILTLGYNLYIIFIKASKLSE
jgi:hypothetical protein